MKHFPVIERVAKRLKHTLLKYLCHYNYAKIQNKSKNGDTAVNVLK